MRARWWSSQAELLLNIDDYRFHRTTTTLWGWPGQNPIFFRDPSGHDWSLDPNRWDDSTQQYFLSGQAERDAIGIIAGIEAGLSGVGLAAELGLLAALGSLLAGTGPAEVAAASAAVGAPVDKAGAICNKKREPSRLVLHN